MQSIMLKLSAKPAHYAHQYELRMSLSGILQVPKGSVMLRSSHDGFRHEGCSTCLHPGEVGEGGIYRHSKDLHQPCCSSVAIRNSCLQEIHEKHSGEQSLPNGHDDATD